jgi:hypothetical protein
MGADSIPTCLKQQKFAKPKTYLPKKTQLPDCTAMMETKRQLDGQYQKSKHSPTTLFFSRCSQVICHSTDNTGRCP